jgi:hypothetical protein
MNNVISKIPKSLAQRGGHQCQGNGKCRTMKRQEVNLGGGSGRLGSEAEGVGGRASVAVISNGAG